MPWKWRSRRKFDEMPAGCTTGRPLNTASGIGLGGIGAPGLTAKGLGALTASDGIRVLLAGGVLAGTAVGTRHGLFEDFRQLARVHAIDLSYQPHS